MRCDRALDFRIHTSVPAKYIAHVAIVIVKELKVENSNSHFQGRETELPHDDIIHFHVVVTRRDGSVILHDDDDDDDGDDADDDGEDHDHVHDIRMTMMMRRRRRRRGP